MTAHDWYVEHCVDFVTRTLDSGDETSFADHLRRCEECKAAVQSIERDFAWLPMGAPPVRPRPGFRRQILRDVLGDRQPAWRRWIVPIALAASVLIAFGLYVSERRESDRIARALSTRTGELMALRDSLSVMRQAARVLQASISMNGHEGGLLIFADDVSHRWNVVVHGLPPAPPGETYQFWFICSDGMVRGATVTSEPGRPVFLTLGMPAEGGTVIGAALTMEPKSNRSPEPRGKELAHMLL
ncbi:MAG: anti-sigma factor [Gemmatimonadaceae bacterium]|nr:anti-sigma factor [Gemmatimonadaceae bacterium]